jgi:hypothetical protein
MAVVVTLVDVGDGTSRIVIDDVRTDFPRRDTAWTFDSFYTHKVLESQKLNEMSLPEADYEGLGVSIIARLLALNGRA